MAHIGGIRIAKIMYEHHPIETDKNGHQISIGGLIDEHIAATLSAGNLVSEVSLFFETPEQQNALRDIYLVPTASVADYGVDDVYPVAEPYTKKGRK